MRLVTLIMALLVPFQALADYVVSVVHVKNGDKTLLADIRHYNSMKECRAAFEDVLLEPNGMNTSGFWIMKDDAPDGLVQKGYFYHDQTGMACIVIPSEKWGSE